MNSRLIRISFVILILNVATFVNANELTPIEQLGESIFNDDNLSINGNQSCAVCHDPEAGWTGPDSTLNGGGAVYEGSIPGRFGNRKPPSSAYATPSPVLFVDKKGLFTGGNFWDGRATGEKLGNPAADQAQGPFLNPAEQALRDSACVVYRVCIASYQGLFENVWGPGVCDIDWPTDIDTECATEGGLLDLSPDNRAKVEMAYDYIALSIAAFEASPESNAFSSKFDAYLAGLVDLTKEEKKGLNVFNGKGKCAKCHTLKGDSKGRPLLTDFTYDNLGTPRNPENPFYDQPDNPLGEDWIDLGLGGFLEMRMDFQQYAAANLGKQKVPTLRNVDKRPYPEFVKAYGHNGYFKSLKGIVHFYNTRDVKPSCESLGILDATEATALEYDCWPEPEVALNVNTEELGDLKLTSEEEDAIVVFMKTLSDGYFEPTP